MSRCRTAHRAGPDRLSFFLENSKLRLDQTRFFGRTSQRTGKKRTCQRFNQRLGTSVMANVTHRLRSSLHTISRRPLEVAFQTAHHSGLMDSTEQQQQHFLFVTFPAQGNINPVRQLARRLAHIAGARVTLATTVFAHRRMFPSSATTPDSTEEHDDGLISYVPYSDGYDAGFDPKTDNPNNYLSRSELVGAQSLSTLVRSLAARKRPVTCIIFALLLTWAADVAHDLGIPSVFFWVQPATAFAIYHRYFHGYKDLISSHKGDPSSSIELPGLLPLQIRDLPSFLTSPDGANDLSSVFLSYFQTMFRTLDKLVSRSKESKFLVLVNTFEELEPAALSAVDEMELLAIGPSIDDPTVELKDRDMFEEDSKGYMEWLDSKKDGSVVYVSFGSIAKLSRRQMEEILRGLVASGRPYLFVVRRDNEEGGEELKLGLEGEGGEMGMVVEWCSQVRVLAHRSIGCFVTHCGWNSTLESMVSGVPMVVFPQFSDQMVNARLVERELGVGVRVEVSGEGEEKVMEGRELERCLDAVMGDGERGLEIRRRAKLWQEKAREAYGGRRVVRAESKDLCWEDRTMKG